MQPEKSPTTPPAAVPPVARKKLAVFALGALLLLGGGTAATIGGAAYYWNTHQVAPATVAGAEQGQTGQLYLNSDNRDIMSIDVTRTYRKGQVVEVFYTVFRHDGYADDCREILYPQYPVTALPPTEQFDDVTHQLWENTDGIKVKSIDVTRAQLDPQQTSKTVYITITTTDGRQFDIAEPLTRAMGQ